MAHPAADPAKAPLAGPLDTPELLLAQLRACERALPAENYPARAGGQERIRRGLAQG